MKRSFPLWQLLGFAIVSFGGTILHFLYEWTGNSLITAPISAVNESTFEHMKLLFIPAFVFAVIESRFFKEYYRFWCVKLRGILLGLILIPVLFYTYNGALGKSPDFVNIAIFFIAAAVMYLYETKAFASESFKCRLPLLSLVILVLLAVLFIVFTFVPPDLPLFVDPTTGGRGISGV